MANFETTQRDGQTVNRKLTVSPWEYSAIVKNANDLTPGEFIEWMLEKFPFLGRHVYQQIDIVVDYGNGAKAWRWSTTAPTFVLNLVSR